MEIKDARVLWRSWTNSSPHTLLSQCRSSNSPFRHLAWLCTLGAGNFSAAAVLDIIITSRRRYHGLKEIYIDEPMRMLQSGVTDDPLSRDEKGFWSTHFRDMSLKRLIELDVGRTFPESEFFRREDIRRAISTCLFLYCSINKDLGYRQGMHDLLALLLKVVVDSRYVGETTETRDKYTQWLAGETSDCPEDEAEFVLSNAFVEHDTFCLFELLMRHMSVLFEYHSDKPGVDDAPIHQLCGELYHDILRRLDNELYLHLMQIELQPQMFGIRWFRVLFSRELKEFPLFKLWDALFADKPMDEVRRRSNYALQTTKLELLPFIACAMLTGLRLSLLNKPFHICLSTLMNYPEGSSIDELITEARVLRRNHSILYHELLPERRARLSPPSRLFHGLSSQPLVKSTSVAEGMTKGGDPITSKGTKVLSGITDLVRGFYGRDSLADIVPPSRSPPLHTRNRKMHHQSPSPPPFLRRQSSQAALPLVNPCEGRRPHHAQRRSVRIGTDDQSGNLLHSLLTDVLKHWSALLEQGEVSKVVSHMAAVKEGLGRDETIANALRAGFPLLGSVSETSCPGPEPCGFLGPHTLTTGLEDNARTSGRSPPSETGESGRNKAVQVEDRSSDAPRKSFPSYRATSSRLANPPPENLRADLAVSMAQPQSPPSLVDSPERRDGQPHRTKAISTATGTHASDSASGLLDSINQDLKEFSENLGAGIADGGGRMITSEFSWILKKR